MISDNLERWSPSVPAPAALLATQRPVDENCEGADSSDSYEDQKPVIATPERPWSPSVPAALTTQGLCRRRTKVRKTQKLDNANGPSHMKSNFMQTPPLSSPTPAPPTSPPDDSGFSTKREPTFATSSSTGSPMTAFVGKPSDYPSDEGNQVPLQTSTDLPSRTNSSTTFTQILPLTERPPSSPSVASQFARSDAALPAPLSVERHPSPSFSISTHRRSPGLRRDQSPSRLSSVSSRGSLGYGPLENSATNIPSHTSSPKVYARKPQTFSWPPFRPNLDDGPTDFDPPFRAGPDFCEPPPPFRPTSGPAMVRTYMAPTPGRPAAISSSNSIPLAPRHSSCVPQMAPAGSSSPTIQPFGPPSISPQPPMKPLQGTVPDGNYPPRQPRADAAMQAMASASLGQGVVPRSQPPQYQRQREYLVLIAAECSCGSWLQSRGANGLVQKGSIIRRARLLMVVDGAFPWSQGQNARHRPLVQNLLRYSKFQQSGHHHPRGQPRHPFVVLLCKVSTLPFKASPSTAPAN